MAEDEDKSQKTEDPTYKKLEDARKKGQLANSREINHLFILFVFALVVLSLSPALMQQTMDLARPFIDLSHMLRIDTESFQSLFQDTMQGLLLVVMVPMMMAFFAAIAAGGLQTRFNISLDPLKPKFDKLSIPKGLGRIFSKKSIVELVKNLLKISFIGGIGVMAIMPDMPVLRILPGLDTMDMLIVLHDILLRLIGWMLAVLFVMAIMDYAYQKFDYMENLKMTKQEVKDEHKQQEGDPLVKQKLRQIRAERSRTRMMADVPKSDVVITNPTHFAVALKYDPDSMGAPVVVAKGFDKVAFRIRDVAEQHKIPVMRNPPLARALYDNVEIGQAITVEYYHAVAQIIGYVYRLKGKKLDSLQMGSASGTIRK